MGWIRARKVRDGTGEGEAARAARPYTFGISFPTNNYNLSGIILQF